MLSMIAVADPEGVANPPIISDFVQKYWIQDWLMWMLLVQILSKHATFVPVIATDIIIFIVSPVTWAQM